MKVLRILLLCLSVAAIGCSDSKSDGNLAGDVQGDTVQTPDSQADTVQTLDSQADSDPAADLLVATDAIADVIVDPVCITSQSGGNDGCFPRPAGCAGGLSCECAKVEFEKRCPAACSVQSNKTLLCKDGG